MDSPMSELNEQSVDHFQTDTEEELSLHLNEDDSHDTIIKHEHIYNENDYSDDHYISLGSEPFVEIYSGKWNTLNWLMVKIAYIFVVSGLLDVDGNNLIPETDSGSKSEDIL